MQESREERFVVLRNMCNFEGRKLGIRVRAGIFYIQDILRQCTPSCLNTIICDRMNCLRGTEISRPIYDPNESRLMPLKERHEPTG